MDQLVSSSCFKDSLTKTWSFFCWNITLDLSRLITSIWLSDPFWTCVSSKKFSSIRFVGMSNREKRVGRGVVEVAEVVVGREVALDVVEGVEGEEGGDLIVESCH